jgi:hypothetical protein
VASGTTLANGSRMHAAMRTVGTATSDSTSNASERALQLVGALDEAWRWATAPLYDADALVDDLAALADRRELPIGSLRALVRTALGEDAEVMPEDVRVAELPEVRAMLGRLRAVARDLDALSLRARATSRRAIDIALRAPELARAAAREVWQGGPSPERDDTLRRLERMPHELKARAEAIRADVVGLPLRADRARRRLLEALRVRGRARIARTDRLAAI